MERWTLEHPQELGLEGVHTLEVRLIAGSVDVVGTDDTDAHLEVHEVNGAPLLVTLEDGTLTVAHERLAWSGLLDWVKDTRKPRTRVSIAVPRATATRLGVVSADAIVTGLTARTESRSVSGDIVLDRLTADVEAQTVSGDLEARELRGNLGFTTVSGDLTVAGGRSDRVRAKTVSGDVTMDLELAAGGGLEAHTVSGDVRTRLAQGTGVRVQVRSTSGTVDSAFPEVTTTRSPGSVKSSGTLGDGAGRLEVRTVSGDVSLLAATTREQLA